MVKKQIASLTTIFIVITCFLLVSLPLRVSAAQVTLEWDANSPAPEGYRLYQRLAGQSYNYDAPACNGAGTTCAIGGLTEGATYYFVVRAFEGSDQSGDSNEVQYTPAGNPTPSPNADSDGDGWADALDAFPQDATEWIDTDLDGTGNTADLDDDADGMPDSWEVQFNLNPLVDDALEDLDGDGISNGEEFELSSDPANVPGNDAPDRPLLSQPDHGATGVELTPTLQTEGFADVDSDSHARTCYQVSTDPDFTHLVFEKTDAQHLTSLTIPELILDPETTYYWRVKFFDQHNGVSDWSEASEFETIGYQEAGDADRNGILDSQAMDGNDDIDSDGTADAVQTGLQGVSTADAFNPNIAVKRISDDVQVGSLLSMDTMLLPPALNQPEQLTGVISFKLYLLNDATTATVTVYFSQPGPSDALWYKYDPDEGWTVYDHAVFSSDRRSVTLVLEDGGLGDQDGIRNGIIVDPAGLGYSSQDSDTSSNPSEGAGSSGCFIDTAGIETRSQGIQAAIALLLFGVCLLFGYARRKLNRI
ncbi:MAG: fibronectin type III domain-containing protein [Desulfatitalea sp.]